MVDLLKGRPYEKEVLSLFQRYEAGTDRIAKLAKQLDKYQSLELSLEYEKKQRIPLFIKFDEYYVRDNSFSNPYILEQIEQLRERHLTLNRTN